MQDYSRLDCWAKVYAGVTEALAMARSANDMLLARRLGNMLAEIPTPKPKEPVRVGEPVSLGVPQWDRSAR